MALCPFVCGLTMPISGEQINSRHRNCVIKAIYTNNGRKPYCEIKNMYKRIAISKLISN